MKILIAYDGSRSAEAAIDEVVRRPWPENSHVRLITIVDRPFAVSAPSGAEVYAPLVERFRASVREEAYQRIQGALAKFSSRSDLTVGYELRDGSAKNGVLEAVRDWKPDLVVAGFHGAGTVTRLFLGSVSHALVTHAPCNVEIVKTAAAP